MDIEEIEKIMNKKTRKGMQVLFDKIKKLPRYGLCWEWMEETKHGDYIQLSDIKDCFKSLVKKEEE